MKGVFFLLIVGLVSCGLPWRRCVYFAFVILVLEGALRKWVLPGQEFAIYFFKDVALLVAYAKYHSAFGLKTIARVPVLITALLIATTVIITADVFNPALSVPAVGLFGAKAYLFYVPLLWMACDMFEQPRHWDQFIYVQLWLAVPVFILAYLQYFSPGDSIINTYAAVAGEKLDAATVGERGNIRVTGTFPYLSGMGCFVTFITLLALGAYQFAMTKRLQTLGLIVLCMAAVAGFMTGGRSVVFSQVAILAGGLYAMRHSASALGGAWLKVLFGVIAIGLVFTKTSASFALESFIYRVKTTDNMLDSIFGPVMSIGEVASTAGLLGYGTGATHQARPSIERVFGAIGAGETPPEFFEWELPRICLEIGVVGIGLWIMLRLTVMLLPFLKLRQSRLPAARGLCFLIGTSMLVQYSIANVLNHVYSLYFWLLAGMALAVSNWQPAAVVGAPRPPPRGQLSQRGVRARLPRPITGQPMSHDRQD